MLQKVLCLGRYALLAALTISHLVFFGFPAIQKFQEGDKIWWLVHSDIFVKKSMCPSSDWFFNLMTLTMIYPRRSNNWGAYWAKPFRNKASSSYPHSLEAQFLRLEELQLALCWQLQDHVPRGKLFWRHGVLCQEQDILFGGDCHLGLQRVLLGLSRGRESDWGSSVDMGLDSSLAGKV